MRSKFDWPVPVGEELAKVRKEFDALVKRYCVTTEYVAEEDCVAFANRAADSLLRHIPPAAVVDGEVRPIVDAEAVWLNIIDAYDRRGNRRKADPDWESPFAELRDKKLRFTLTEDEWIGEIDRFPPPVVVMWIQSFVSRAEQAHNEGGAHVDTGPGKYYSFRRNDYRNAYYDDADGKEHQIRIAHLLDKLGAPDHIKKAMTKLPQRGDIDVEVEFSDDPVDVLRASTGQYWTSCMDLRDTRHMKRAVYQDVENGNAVAIVRVAPSGKPIPKKWWGRMTLRWCKDRDDGHIDIGPEGEVYGPNNAVAQRLIKSRITDFLIENDYLAYVTCETPYEVEYSDVRSSHENDDSSNVVYGDWEPDETWSEELIEEYTRTGIAHCPGDNIERFSDIYFEGNLADLLLDNIEYHNDGDSFEDISGCIETDESDGDYRIWKQFGDDWKDVVEMTDYAELHPSAKFNTAVKLITAEGRELPVMFRRRNLRQIDDAFIDTMDYHRWAADIEATAEAWKNERAQWQLSGDVMDTLRLMAAHLSKDLMSRLLGGGLEFADGEELVKVAERYGDAAYVMCRQIEERPNTYRALLPTDFHSEVAEMGLEYWNPYDSRPKSSPLYPLHNDDDLKPLFEWCERRGGSMEMHDRFQDRMAREERLTKGEKYHQIIDDILKDATSRDKMHRILDKALAVDPNNPEAP